MFVVEVPELPGCMAHGDDQESALRNVKDTMQFWIAKPEGSGSCSLPEASPSSLATVLSSGLLSRDYCNYESIRWMGSATSSSSTPREV